MRPVNLIPPDERRDRGPLRTGAVSYLLVGALAVLFFAVVVMALTSKGISSKEDEKQRLQGELAEATARAEALREFADFRTIHETRTATVSSLAQSRFDWERVMKELSLVIPPSVWLINLTGTVNPQVQVNGAAEVTMRDSVAGPALEMVGCASTQDEVAGFVAALEDIDGVTRVGVESSSRNESSGTDGGGATTDAGSSQTVDDCRVRDFIYQFKIVIAFDAVPPPASATAAPGVPPGATPGAAPAALANTQAGDAVSGG